MRCCTVCCTRCCYLPVLVTPLTPLRLLCRPPPPPWAALQLSLEQKQIDISTLSAAAAAAEAWAICTSAFIAHTQAAQTHTHTRTHNSCAILCVGFVSVSLLTCKLQLQLYRCTFCLLPCGSFLGYTVPTCAAPLEYATKSGNKNNKQQQTLKQL